MKVKSARHLATSKPSAVIFCREVRLVEEIAKHLDPQLISIAHSQLGDRYIANIELFKRGARTILVMTRDLGKRGVDFPMARSLIVCSPKSSSTTMDQELCRTRSIAGGQQKQVYLLFYANTYEEEKLRSVLRQLVGMRMYKKFEKFTVTKRWKEWLDQRPPITFLELISI